MPRSVPRACVGGEPASAGRDVAVDAVVLAGGRGARLGGVDKAALRVGGGTLLERLLVALHEAPAVAHTVVVGPRTLPVGGLVLHALEDPAGSGPVAALGAGMTTLAAQPRSAGWTLVLAVDQPGAATAVPALVNAVTQAEQTEPDGPVVTQALVPRDEEGRWQWLLAAYRSGPLRDVLQALPSLSDVAMRRVFGDLRVGDLPLDSGVLGDIDTPQDLARWRAGSQGR